jgi:hypothetical protein
MPLDQRDKGALIHRTDACGSFGTKRQKQRPIRLDGEFHKTCLPVGKDEISIMNTKGVRW